LEIILGIMVKLDLKNEIYLVNWNSPKTMINISSERCLEICRWLDLEIKLQTEGILIIQQLIRPWILAVSKLTDPTSLQEFIESHFPSELEEIIQAQVQKILDLENEDPSDLLVNLSDHFVKMDRLQTCVIEVLIGTILEVAIEKLRDRYARDLDSYDIYTGIFNHPVLFQLFENSVPPFLYPDQTQIVALLNEFHPTLSFTSGFTQGLQNYLNTLMGLIIHYDVSKIDAISQQFEQLISDHSPNESESRYLAIQRLKQSAVNYFVHQCQKIRVPKLAFSHLINAIQAFTQLQSNPFRNSTI